MTIEKQNESASGERRPATLDESELRQVTGGPNGPPWQESLTAGELRRVTGGPSGPPWQEA